MTCCLTGRHADRQTDRQTDKHHFRSTLFVQCLNPKLVCRENPRPRQGHTGESLISLVRSWSAAFYIPNQYCMSCTEKHVQTAKQSTAGRTSRASICCLVYTTPTSFTPYCGFFEFSASPENARSSTD